MSLIIKHNRADHTHENEQFRRIAKSLRLLFQKQNWNGILIGNPFNENYSRFRPDGILLYNYGLIIIDLKAYSGTLRLPSKKVDFETTLWYADSATDNNRILIKSGNRFINPFKQLDYYRSAFKEIVYNEKSLNGLINPHRTFALNIFSGPLKIENSVPGEIPYYKLVQESDLGNLLYVYSSDNSYSEELANSLSTIFDADVWQDDIQMPEVTSSVDFHKKIEVTSDVESAVSEFLRSNESGVLVLESMDVHVRDNWVHYILSKTHEYHIPQIESCVHSARIGKVITNRIGIEFQSLYSTIYGGSPKEKAPNSVEIDVESRDNTVTKITSEADVIEQDIDENQEQEVESPQKIVPIRTDDLIDNSSVLILHEAHLVSRSLHQSELLRFGSGRLLEDLFAFLNLENSKRKLILIGDPFSLTYGKETESSLNFDTLKELYSGKITHYRNPISNSTSGKIGMRVQIANSLEKRLFNNLGYLWQENDLEHISKDVIPSYLMQWFKDPVLSDPDKTVMVYSNKDAKKINLWIKSNVIKNGPRIAPNDLLIINNNIHVPDNTGFGQPATLYNGMFLLVDSIGGTIEREVFIKQSSKPIILSFSEVNVICLSLSNKLKTSVYILDNYFESDNGLSKEEQIAFRVLIDQLLKEKEKELPFENSREFSKMHQDVEYVAGLKNMMYLNNRLESGEKVKTILNKEKSKISRIEKKYRSKFKSDLLNSLSKNNPFLNAIHAHYGWALTVHKCVGLNFSTAILNAYQGENRGITNSEYYRWLYSGITTTSNSLMVVNPQLVHPLMNTHFEDTVQISTTKSEQKKKVITFSNYMVDDKYRGKITTDLNTNVVGVICELSNSFEKLGLVLDSVSKTGDYLTKARYGSISNIETHVVLAINNKGPNDNWGVSSIRIEHLVNFETTQVNQIIENLFTFSSPSNYKHSMDLPQDFRLPIYMKWQETLQKLGFQIKYIDKHNFQDVFLITDESNIISRIRVWYNLEGYISKISIIEKNNSEISNQLKEWLLYGN